MLVHQILKDKADQVVVTLPPESSLSEAAEVLSTRRIGAIIISKDGTHPLGILSERDLVRELGRVGSGCLAQPVTDVMTSKLTTATRDETAVAVLQKMSDGRFRHMPVMDGDTMVGLISIGDVVKARLSELSMEKDALQGMIMGH
ncbi:MAG: CBS domain-containing protein [Halocynthiibacter sp.]|jgi:CBS domain-containing protein